RLAEGNAFGLESAGEPFMLIDADARVERKVGADAEEHAPPLVITQIEVVLPDEPRTDLDAVAATGAGIADGHPSVLAALEDDDDPQARAKALIERLDPVFATDAFGRLDDGDLLRCRQLRDEAMVVFRDLAEVAPGNRRHLAILVQEANDHARLLHRLHDGV